MVSVLENRFYYLDNFHIVLEWISGRYSDLLTCEEGEFIRNFHLLPRASRALLVRLVMRKGDLFRSGKLEYSEIGAIETAIAPLIELGWIDRNPLLKLEALFGLLKKTEIAHIFGPALLKNAVIKAKKPEQLLALSNDILVTQNFSSWYPESEECVYQVCVGGICDHIKLLFFGNLHQDWTEFVLADLGVFKYEKVALTPLSRGFQSRKDVDDYHFLFQCRERFRQGEAPESVLKDIPTDSYESILSEGRRSKLLFQIGQHYEKNKEFTAALKVYERGNYPGSRMRIIRTMERTGQFELALILADAAQCQPESEAEKQQLQRIFPRLNRHLDRPKMPTIAKVSVPRIDLSLPNLSGQTTVEERVRDHLEKNGQSGSAPILDDAHLTHVTRVYYVENGLINSLFGLLCWSAVFAPIPNAFFHPFHTGPADLYGPEFYQRRAVQFDECLRQLDSDQYIVTIRQYFKDKWGIQSPFVFWPLMTETLLDLALSCIPADHLKHCFERILSDIKFNRAGFPDLIQFWPGQRTYRMIEVKGPGDRLQDNQLRWIDYCASHAIPIAVCYVQWAE